MQNILFLLRKYAKDITIFFLLLVCLGLIIYKYFEPEKETESVGSIAMLEKENNPEEISEKATTPIDNYIYVDIKGAVKKPGVYKILNTAIINDAINMAGGFTSNAYQNNINLSKKICAEMVIYVYQKSEIMSNKEPTISKDTPKIEHNSTNSTETEKPVTDNTNKSEESLIGPSINIVTPNTSCEAGSYDIAQCLEDKNSIIISEDVCKEEIDDNKNNQNNETNENNTTNSNAEKNLVNINTADVALLTSLTGIGESKAKTIITHREENGAFKSISDILNVKGIGEKLFEKIKDFITV